MNPSPIQTPNLQLIVQSREDVLAAIEQMEAGQKAELSSAWLDLLATSGSVDPWIHGFNVVHRGDNTPVGTCGFKGPPGADGMVEIAYGIAPEHQGKGYATEAAAALTAYAYATGQVRLVCAHTLPKPSASTRVLTKCGFRHVGEVIDPDDGLVWRWEIAKAQ